MIKIYTDASCLGNPGNGGWAAIINNQGNISKISGRQKNTTNNQMELLAAIKALKKIPIKQEVQLYTDSKYVKMGITEWIKSWKVNNWKTYSKKNVKNKDLWIELDCLSNKYEIKWLWVKGHSGDVRNEEVDKLAKQAANLN